MTNIKSIVQFTFDSFSCMYHFCHQRCHTLGDFRELLSTLWCWLLYNLDWNRNNMLENAYNYTLPPKWSFPHISFPQDGMQWSLSYTKPSNKRPRVCVYDASRNSADVIDTPKSLIDSPTSLILLHSEYNNINDVGDGDN